MSIRTLLFSTLLLCACALGPGDPFGRASATLSARLTVPADREAGGGWIALASNYQVRFDRAELRPGPLELIAFSASGGSFDPANPPPGYSLCHSGHCHSADGRLVPYEEVAAELAGGGASATGVAAFEPPPGTVDLLTGVANAPLECEESCELPATTLRRITVPLQALVLEGVVRDTEIPARVAAETPWRIALPIADIAAVASADIDVPLDRVSPPQVSFTVSFTPSPAILDPVDFGALTPDGDGVLDLSMAANLEALEPVLERLASTTLTAEVERSPF